MKKRILLVALAGLVSTSFGASTIQFEAARFEANEDDGMAYVTITCTPPPASPVTARLVRTGGTADKTDFKEAYWWDDGAGVGIYPMNFEGNPDFKAKMGLFLLDDTISESDETVSFTITGIEGPAVAGTLTNAVLTIHNGRPRIWGYTDPAPEGEPLLCTLRRAGDTNISVSFDYSTHDDTARGDIDYIPVTGTLTFAAGELSSQIQIATLDNSRVDGSREFQIRLSNPSSGVSLVSTQIAALISDNEWPVIWDQSLDPKECSYAGSFCVAPDGKLIISQYLPDDDVSRIVRLNADGSIDPTFGPAFLSPYGAQGLVLDSEGRCLVVGIFHTVNNRPRPGLARLAQDGALDDTFNPPGTLATYPGSLQIALQPDGRILFLNFGNQPKFVRLNADGSLDNTFHPAAATTNAYHVISTASSRAIASVSFGYTNTAQPLVRLELDGTLDATFHRAEFTARANAGPGINALTLQADGKLLVAGEFQSVDGYPRSSIVRLNADGTVDTSFAPTPGAESGGYPGRIISTVIDSRNRVVLTGDFTHFNGRPVTVNLVRLNPDGTLESAFAPGSDPFQELASSFLDPNQIFVAGWIESIALQPDDNLLMKGVIWFRSSLSMRIPPKGTVFLARMYSDPPTNSFAFTGPEFVVQEGDSHAIITVRRLGDLARFATVDFATSDGSALAGQNYRQTVGTLAFAPLELIKSFNVPLLNNFARDRDLDLSLTLSGTTGGEVISGPRARLIIAKPFGFHAISYLERTREFIIFGSPGSTYLLESIYWPGESITMVTLTNSVQSITDSSTSGWDVQPTERFYRLRRSGALRAPK